MQEEKKEEATGTGGKGRHGKETWPTAWKASSCIWRERESAVLCNTQRRHEWLHETVQCKLLRGYKRKRMRDSKEEGEESNPLSVTFVMNGWRENRKTEMKNNERETWREGWGCCRWKIHTPSHIQHKKTHRTTTAGGGETEKNLWQRDVSWGRLCFKSLHEKLEEREKNTSWNHS